MLISRLLRPWINRSHARLTQLCIFAMPKRSRSNAEAEQAWEPSPSPAAKKNKPKKKAPAALEPTVNVKELAPKVQKIITALNTHFPPPVPIPLDHSSSFQLLVAVVLSAQSTDVKVNTVTPELFRLYPDAPTMAQAPVQNIERIIKVLGLAPTKARNLSALSQMLVEQHQGEVPGSFEELEALPGVGHKTASVVMAQAFNVPAFAVDTHIHRLAQRWGLTNGHSVEQTEADLKALFPQETWIDAHLQIIYFGREHCPAVSHDPTGCPICAWAAVPPYNKPGQSPARPGQKPKGMTKAVRKMQLPEEGAEGDADAAGLVQEQQPGKGHAAVGMTGASKRNRGKAVAAQGSAGAEELPAGGGTKVKGHRARSKAGGKGESDEPQGQPDMPNAAGLVTRSTRSKQV